jgi:hypothetical protein
MTSLALKHVKKKSRRKKTGYTRKEWKEKFAAAAKYCAAHRAPGERIQDCIRKQLASA